MSSFISISPSLQRNAAPIHVLSRIFDSTATPARQAGALHKAMARHAETAYFEGTAAGKGTGSMGKPPAKHGKIG
jgi:hypothetical protein